MKKNIDKFAGLFFFLCALIASSIVFITIIFIAQRGIKPFLSNELDTLSIQSFLTGKSWISHKFYSVGFIILNTVYISFLTLILALPISVLSALFIAKIAPKPLASFLRTIIELLAAIPSVVYGVFGAGVIIVFTQNLGETLGIPTMSGTGTLATVLVLTLMTLPTITVISETALRAVPQDVIEASLALGATKTQTNFKIVLISAKSGIFSAAILGIGRALGEATAVSMVAGNTIYGPTFNLLSPTRTLTSTILAGIKETTGIDYDIRFSVGIVLMIVILLINVILNYVKKKVGKMDE